MNVESFELTCQNRLGLICGEGLTWLVEQTEGTTGGPVEGRGRATGSPPGCIFARSCTHSGQ